MRELKRPAFKNRCELTSLGDVKQRHRQDTCPHVQQQLLTESNSALLHIRGAAAAAALCLALMKLPLYRCFDSTHSSINISAVKFMPGDLSKKISAVSHQHLRCAFICSILLFIQTRGSWSFWVHCEGLSLQLDHSVITLSVTELQKFRKILMYLILILYIPHQLILYLKQVI